MAKHACEVKPDFWPDVLTKSVNLVFLRAVFFYTEQCVIVHKQFVQVAIV